MLMCDTKGIRSYVKHPTITEDIKNTPAPPPCEPYTSWSLIAQEQHDEILELKRTSQRLQAECAEKDAALQELAGIYDAQYGAYNQLLLDALKSMNDVIDSFIRDCKKHRMKIPYDVFYGSYKQLQNKYLDVQNLIREEARACN